MRWHALGGRNGREHPYAQPVMDVLTPEELRVLGCLIEKQATTPDQYPLTMNGLLSACNQTSNRNPVLHWTETDVAPVLSSLRQKGLARVVHSSGQRADKYRHVADEAWGLTAAELAVVAVLALRGPQTVNELRTRTERYADTEGSTDIEDLGGVAGVLHRLKNRYDEPYVTRLERGAGQREERWAHLLAGEVLDVPELSESPRRSSTERIDALETQLAAATAELAVLRAQMAELRELLD